MTDAEIRALIRWQYDRGRKDPSPMAEIIYRIACMVRDRIQTWTESDIILNLRARLAMAEFSKNAAFRILEQERQTDWRDRYYRLHKIHREDVRRRKEVRRFRLANFSIAEME